MIIAVTGSSGFIGRRLTQRLRTEGHTVREISLRRGPVIVPVCHAVVHLAGEPVAQRWTRSARDRIRNSRVEGTKFLVKALSEHPPPVLISASAIGYYGSRGGEILTETSKPGGDFLAQVVIGWEREARSAEQFGVRVVPLRFGAVLGRGGGALKKILLPFRLGLGGRLGSGQQWMSWIHLDDLIALIGFAIESEQCKGVMNAVAPHPVTNDEFTHDLARALHRPAVFPVPEFGLKLLYGEMSQVILGSQRVVPEAALQAGFQFRFAELGPALRQIVA
ncbi:MAG TPA: TIGR01777 family oxidoreductase [Bryobacteraceae bacterium]|nr:TIGR01777 family oxidoreductase [Bryobacteraceae bacterium]